jgi:hypothetical protein
VSSRAETLPKNLIAHLPMQDLNGRDFGGLLSQTAMHAVVRMGKTRGQRSKGNFTRERQMERARSRYSLGAEPLTEPPFDSVGAPSKNLVFYKMSLSVQGEAGGRRSARSLFFFSLT